MEAVFNSIYSQFTYFYNIVGFHFLFNWLLRPPYDWLRIRTDSTDLQLFRQIYNWLDYSAYIPYNKHRDIFEYVFSAKFLSPSPAVSCMMRHECAFGFSLSLVLFLRKPTNFHENRIMRNGIFLLIRNVYVRTYYFNDLKKNHVTKFLLYLQTKNWCDKLFFYILKCLHSNNNKYDLIRSVSHFIKFPSIVANRQQNEKNAKSRKCD